MISIFNSARRFYELCIGSSGKFPFSYYNLLVTGNSEMIKVSVIFPHFPRCAFAFPEITNSSLDVRALEDFVRVIATPIFTTGS